MYIQEMEAEHCFLADMWEAVPSKIWWGKSVLNTNHLFGEVYELLLLLTSFSFTV